MQNSGLLDPFPLWTLLPITITIALVSVELGFRVALYRKQRSTDEPEAPAAGMVGVALGLLAFMLAFTFGLAGTRFEARRQLVQTEANAISTTYLRADLLPEPMHTDAQSLLREYVDARLAGTSSDKLLESISKSEEVQRRLWSQAVLALQKGKVCLNIAFQSIGYPAIRASFAANHRGYTKPDTSCNLDRALLGADFGNGSGRLSEWHG